MRNWFKRFTVLAILAAVSGLAVGAASSNYLQNQTFDLLLRNQALSINSKTATWSAQTTVYVGLFTSTVNAQSCAGEVSTSGTNYARIGVASSLSNWSGTQGAGTTTASSNATGSSGTVSNNNAITFGAPSASWGTINNFCIHDAVTGGNELFYAPLTTPKTVNNGDAAPSFAAGALQITIGWNVPDHWKSMLAANSDELQAAA